MASKKNSHKGEEPVGWVTVKGVHFPKWADGTIGWEEGQANVNDKGTMSTEELNKAELRRDELWDKEDKHKITKAEKKELDNLQQAISEHYAAKRKYDSKKVKEVSKEVKSSQKSTPVSDEDKNWLHHEVDNHMESLLERVESEGSLSDKDLKKELDQELDYLKSQGFSKEAQDYYKSLYQKEIQQEFGKSIKETKSRNGADKDDDFGNAETRTERISVYKEQLSDVQDDIKQFESTSPRMRAVDYDEKLAALKKKEAELKQWIERDAAPWKKKQDTKQTKETSKYESKKVKEVSKEAKAGYSNRDDQAAGEGSYTVSINRGVHGTKRKTFKSAAEADKYVSDRVKAGDGSGSDYSIKYAARDNKKFSANSSAERINAISKHHNNGGSEGEDWKKVRAELDNAPTGTVMIQTGNRGAKFQYEKQANGDWKDTNTGYVQNSKTVSMGWVGSGLRPQVEFTTSKNALTNEQVKDTQDAAVSGRLNQALGLDRNGRKIGNRSTSKVDSSVPKTISRNAKYDTGRATLTSKSSSQLKTMYKNASPEEQKKIASEMAIRGFYRKDGKWYSRGGGR